MAYAATRTVPGTSDTPTTSDDGGLVQYTSASAKTITLTNSSWVAGRAAFAARISGGGTATFVAGSGVTVNGDTSIASGQTVVCQYTAANTWEIVGTDVLPVASGGTGASTAAAARRNLQALGPVFDVRAYGAAGNGTTDDTAAIQAAIDAAAATTSTWFAYSETGHAGVVYVPPGAYLVSETLNVKCAIVGAGERVSVLIADSPFTGDYVLNITDPTGLAFGHLITDLNINVDGASGVGGVTGTRANEGSGCERVTVSGLDDAIGFDFRRTANTGDGQNNNFILRDLHCTFSETATASTTIGFKLLGSGPALRMRLHACSGLTINGHQAAGAPFEGEGMHVDGVIGTEIENVWMEQLASGITVGASQPCLGLGIAGVGYGGNTGSAAVLLPTGSANQGVTISAVSAPNNVAVSDVPNSYSREFHLAFYSRGQNAAKWISFGNQDGKVSLTGRKSDPLSARSALVTLGLATDNTNLGNTFTSTDYTLVLSDAGKLIEASTTSATPLVVTVPPAASVAFAVGDIVDVAMFNTGPVTVQGGSGVTLLGGSTTIRRRGGMVRLIYRGSDTWYCSPMAVASAGSAYTATNVTTDRAFDANATTLDELADVVGTLIADLRSAGIVL